MKNTLLLLSFLCMNVQAQETQVYFSRDVDQLPFIRSMVCESPGSMSCFEEQIRAHVSNTIRFPEEAKRKQLSGKAYVQFTVGVDGRVSNVKARAKHNVFTEEALRLTELIPELKPAMKEGKPVAMSYTFPLDFSFTEEPVPFEETTYPPEFGNCQESDDLKYCLQSYFFDTIGRRIMENPEISRAHKRDPKYQVWSRFYFEITPDAEVSNITVVSNEQIAKQITEDYLKNELRIHKPARNEVDEPILCSYLEEIRMLAIKREKRVVPDK